MTSILQIRLNENINAEQNKAGIENDFTYIIETAKNAGIWDEQITAIIITDDLEGDITRQATEWNIPSSVSKDRGFHVSSKILFSYKKDKPEYHIYFPTEILWRKDISLMQIVFIPILSVFTERILPEKLRNLALTYPLTLDKYVTFASAEWCKADYIRVLSKNVFSSELFLMNQNSFLIAFKRKLKKSLFEYRSDKFDEQKRFDDFVFNYLDNVKSLFLRVVENESDNKELQIKETEPCWSLIRKVVDEVAVLRQCCVEGMEYDIAKLKEAVIQFSAHFDIILEKENEDGFYVRFEKEPKDYFKNELIETEPRIVCFMDILGFSELIENYDTDITSTVLQDIQESFSLAKKYLFENEHQNKEIVRHLKYQTFSDCICISIPYYDNESDFLSNFNLLITYVRGFQLAMMAKGFFTRGGISTGSHYADSNIIFSKGLVSAYLIESTKAVYPRVVVDRTIIERILGYNQQKVKSSALDKVIIIDWENIAFLNPFGLGESSIHQFESMFAQLKHDSNEPLTEVLSTLTKTMSEMTVGLWKNVSEQEKKEIENIKRKIAENIWLHRKNERILSKYLWLYEFVKWYEKDASGKLTFQFLTDRMSPE